MKKLATEIISVADRADLHGLPKHADALLRVASIILAQGTRVPTTDDLAASDAELNMNNQAQMLAAREKERKAKEIADYNAKMQQQQADAAAKQQAAQQQAQEIENNADQLLTK